jgi:hypothetical protein
LAACGSEGDVADLVDDQQGRPEQLAQLLVETALPLGVAEAGDRFGRGRERDPLAGKTGADPERDREDASLSVVVPMGQVSGMSVLSSGCWCVRAPSLI